MSSTKRAKSCPASVEAGEGWISGMPPIFAANRLGGYCAGSGLQLCLAWISTDRGSANPTRHIRLSGTTHPPAPRGASRVWVLRALAMLGSECA